MATKKNAKLDSRQGANNRGGNDSFYLPPASVSSNSSNEDSEMGFIVYLIATMVMFGVLLPLMAMLYFDILQVREETKQQQKTVQKLIEKSKEEK